MNSLETKYTLVWTGTLNGVPMSFPNRMAAPTEESLYAWLNHYVSQGWVVDTLEVSEVK